MSGTAAQAPALPALDNTMGALFIGVLIGGVLWGVSCLQYWNYVHTYENDVWYIKTMVAVAWLSDTAHQILVSHSLYTYVITNYFNPVKLGEIVWSMVIEVLAEAITALIVQSFFAFRIWHLSGNSILLVGSVVALIIANFVSLLVYVAKAISLKTYVELQSLKGLSETTNVLSAATDVIIAASLCWLLQNSRTGFKQSDTIIRKMMLFSLNTGLLTSLCAVVSLITILALPNTFVYICFFFVLSRLYINSLLATLNVRALLRKQSEATHELGSVTLNSVARRYGANVPKGSQLDSPAAQNSQIASISFTKEAREPDVDEQYDYYGAGTNSRVVDVKPTV